MADQGDEELFSDQFIIDLRDQFDMTSELVYKCLLPYLALMCLDIYYFMFVFNTNDTTANYICISIEMVGLIYFSVLEICQCRRAETFMSYFVDPWNWLLWATIFIKLVIFTSYFLKTEGLWMAMLASICGFLMTFQLFFWTQIYRDIAMYWRIIVDSISGAAYFAGFVLVLLFSFACAMVIFDLQQSNLNELKVAPVYNPEAPFETITETKFDWRLTDSLFTQYLLMLGEFEYLGSDAIAAYPQSSRTMIYAYFLISTLITQTVFMNQLVSVLGEVYGARWGVKERLALRQQTKMYSDYVYFLNKKVENGYLYVIRPTVEAEDQNFQDIRDEMNSATASLSKRLDQLEESQQEARAEIKDQFDALKSLIQERKQ